MSKLIPYETFIARRAENEVKRLDRKEQRSRRAAINRLLGYACH